MNKYLHFKSHIELYRWIESHGINIDINKTVLSSRYTLVINGKRLFHGKLHDMIVTLNKHLPEDYQLDENLSQIKGKLSYMLFFKESDNSVESDVVEGSEDIEEGIDLSLIDFEAENEGVSAEVEYPDFEYAESLQEGNSKAEAKNLLEDYARTFGVELAKNKKFENMMEDFKESF